MEAELAPQTPPEVHPIQKQINAKAREQQMALMEAGRLGYIIDQTDIERDEHARSLKKFHTQIFNIEREITGLNKEFEKLKAKEESDKIKAKVPDEVIEPNEQQIV